MQVPTLSMDKRAIGDREARHSAFPSSTTGRRDRLFLIRCNHSGRVPMHIGKGIALPGGRFERGKIFYEENHRYD